MCLIKSIAKINLNICIGFLQTYLISDQNQAKRVIPYLRAKLRKSVPFNRMKLMVVGLQVGSFF